MKIRKNILRTLKQNKTINKDERGVAAVEFALLAPVLLAILFGSVEVSQAVTIDRKVTQAASTIADLVAQSADMDCATLRTAVAVTREVFEPYDNEGTAAAIHVASVSLVGGTPKVEWSKSVNNAGVCSNSGVLPVGMTVSQMGTDAMGNPADMVAPLIPDDTHGVILGQVELAYTSLGTSFFTSSINMSERYFVHPRLNNKVCYAGVTVPGCN